MATLARKIGLRHRYLRFFGTARLDAPLLEIGCGDGNFLNELIGFGFERVLGLEPSSSYVNVADDRLIVRCFANEYLEQCPAASLGTVIALDVFEHIPLPDLRVLLAMIHDRLMPGGMVLFRVPNMASPLALPNFFGDLSHVTPLSGSSIRQLVFDSNLTLAEVHAEPLAYPRSVRDVFGIGMWHVYRFILSSVLRAFGIRNQVLTPNVVCVLRKASSVSDHGVLLPAARAAVNEFEQVSRSK